MLVRYEIFFVRYLYAMICSIAHKQRYMQDVQKKV